jgi:molybdopterin-guanine dinucleotide biosynthesis protein A
VIGVIVAGGRNARFGGEPKGLHTVGGRRIIDRVAEALRPVTPRLMLVANAAGADAWLPGAATRGDRRAERGSLVGIHTALAAADDDVLVVAWDMPFVETVLLALLRDTAAAAPEAYAVVPEGPRGAEPFCAVYRRACLPVIEAALDAGDLRLSHMYDRLPSSRRLPLAAIAALGDPERIFFNVNDAADLARAESMAAALPAQPDAARRTAR